MGILLSFIFGGGKGTKLSIILLVAVLAVVGTFVGMKMIEIKTLNHKLEVAQEKNIKLTADNTQLIANNKILQDNQKLLEEANGVNRDTINKLLAEREQSKHAIANLAAANKRGNEALDKLSEKIDEMMKDPLNDGLAAPVLKEAINQIQQERAAK